MSAEAQARARERRGHETLGRLTRFSSEGIAGTIYGTIVVAGVLAADPYGTGADAVVTAVTALGTVIVFWLGHAWAHYLARRAKEGPQARIGRSLAGDWPMVLAAVPPLIVLAVSSILGAEDDIAIEIAEWACTLLLAGWGALIAYNEGMKTLGIVMSAGICGALGLVMVALKVALH